MLSKRRPRRARTSCSSSFQTACWEADPIRTSHEYCITITGEALCELNPGPKKFPTTTMSEGIYDVLDDPEGRGRMCLTTLWPDVLDDPEAGRAKAHVRRAL